MWCINNKKNPFWKEEYLKFEQEWPNCENILKLRWKKYRNIRIEYSYAGLSAISVLEWKDLLNVWNRNKTISKYYVTFESLQVFTKIFANRIVPFLLHFRASSVSRGGQDRGQVWVRGQEWDSGLICMLQAAPFRRRDAAGDDRGVSAGDGSPCTLQRQQRH